MSAAGLGLSLPTAGQAATGAHAQEFDLQACLAFGIEEQAPCATLVAASGASLPAATVPAADGLPPARVEADPAVPRHKSVVAVAVTDDEEFVRVSNAIALIVSAEPAPTESPLAFARLSTTEMPPPQARRVVPSLPAEPSSPPLAAEGPADGAATTNSGERTTGPERSSEDFVLETLAAVLGAETPAGPRDSADTAGAVVRQSLPDVPPPVATRSDVRHGQRDAEGAHAQQSSEHAARRPVNVDAHIDRGARTGKAGRGVETPSERVLLDLQAVLLRSGDGPMALNARVEPKVDVSQEEKVLDTLSQILGKRAESDDMLGEPDPLLASPSDDLAQGSSSGPISARDLAPPPAAAATPANGSAQASAAEKEPSSSQGGQATPEAEAHLPKPAVFGRAAVAVAADKLDGVRGGFETAGGLKVSFGIERAVYLDGALVSTTRLNVADLSRTSAGAAQSRTNGVEAAAGTLAVIQSGSGNTVTPLALSPTSIGTLIQNSIDGRKIQTITRIDAVVNSASIMRTLNLQSSLRSAITDSLRR